jgi:hypothetical protein
MRQGIILLLFILLASCSNRKTPTYQYPQEPPTYIKNTEGEKSDSAVSESPSIAPVNPRAKSHSSIHKEKDLDNMRGFDPASEDDMDDNGMSRYMENNDEEGWD